MTSISDLNILFCYNQEKLGAIKRAHCLQEQSPKEVELHSVPVQKVQDIDDDFTHVILDKTVANTPIEQNYEQKLVLANCHREQYQNLNVNEMLVYDFKMPYTVCRYNLQYPYERQYTYIGPLVKRVQTKPIEDRAERLFVTNGQHYMFELAKFIVEHVNDVKWIIATKTEKEYEILKDTNNYGHEVVYTKELEPLLERAKYVVHYGSHQLALECISTDQVQLIIPPPHSRYYYQHAFRIREFLIGSFVFDLFHRVPIERKYRIIRRIRCNYKSYRSNLQNYREKEENSKVVTCTLPTLFIQNSKT